jgi:flagellar hook-basal body complex protein FliE
MPIEAIGAIGQQAMQAAQSAQAPNSLGAEAQIDGVGSLGAEAQIGTPVVQPSGSSFGEVLTGQLQALNSVQQQADAAQQALASGQTTDVTEVVVAAERAQLSMQLATGVRNRLVDAYNELLRTQV